MKSFEHITVKLFAEHQNMLSEQLNVFLNTLHPLLQADVTHALEEAGKLFSHTDFVEGAPPAGMWSLLPLLVAQCLSPNIDIHRACRVAVAIECFICALDLLDDVEDGDQTPIVKKLGIARVLNVSTTLLALTNHILLTLTELGASPDYVTRLLEVIQDSLIIATVGQHCDILAEQRTAESFTSEECIEIAAGKAGALMSLACHVGALCANASDEVLSQFSEFGTLLGIAQQLDNDSHDLYRILQQQTSELTGTVKTDLIRQKKTLPIVLAAQTTSTLKNTSLVTDEEKQKVFIDALHEGIITTWGISLLYRERAHDQLQKIEAQHPISQMLRLLLGFA